MLDLFDTTWHNHDKELKSLKLTLQDLEFYYSDSQNMILNWLDSFLKDNPKDLQPKTEQKLFSKQYKVWGIIDIIKNGAGIPHIIDYKTCKSMELTDEYRLQLAIYSLLYYENMGTMPAHMVGIHFVKFKDGLKLFRPTQKAIEYAIEKINLVRSRTNSTDINDYPCTCGGWCRKDFDLENGQD